VAITEIPSNGHYSSLSIPLACGGQLPDIHMADLRSGIAMALGGVLHLGRYPTPFVTD
jgi:hypothetical protein